MTQEENKDILIRMLVDTDNILNDLNIEYWLDCGTLLGAIRDNQLISWDNDIDLGCWKTTSDYEMKQELRSKFEELDYEVFLTDHYLNIHFKNHSDLNMDLNFYTDENDNAVTPSSSLYPYLNDSWSKLTNHIIKSVYNGKYYLKRYSRVIRMLFKLVLWLHNVMFSLFPSKIKSKYLNALIKLRKKTSNHKAEVVPKIYFQEIKFTKILDGEYPIPEEADSYLYYRYGENWRTPVQDWDTFNEDGTIQ
jgi:phosphorylcholine metabolism protein LicD